MEVLLDLTVAVVTELQRGAEGEENDGEEEEGEEE